MKHASFMKRKLLCITFCSLFCIASFTHHAQSQPTHVKFGDINPQDLEMAVYAPDTSAGAVVLHDIGQSYFRFWGGAGVKLIFERHVRIKILKKSGYEWANASIAYLKANSSKKEVITGLKGATYNLADGKVQVDKLGKESIFDEKTTDNFNLKKFTFPNVKEGSVLEYSYTLESDFYTHFRDWDFQTSIPTVWSEYNAKIPAFFNYKQIAHGYEPLAVNTQKVSNGNMGGHHTLVTEYKWAMKEVPGLKEEPYITCLNDYRSRIEFELALITIPGVIHQPYMNTWEKINTELLESDLFGRQLNKTGFAKTELAALVNKHSDLVQRMSAIHSYLAHHIKWNDKQRVAVESATATKKAYENRTGSSADINLLLVALLREAKFEAHPVILSTRDHGRLNTSFPMITRFNYVVAHVTLDGKQYLLDATEPLAPVNLLPVRCLNGQGLLISEQNSRWVNLQPSHKYTAFYNAKLTMDQAGSLSGTIQSSRLGYEALPTRRTITLDGKQQYLDELKKQSHGWDIKKIDLKNLEDLNQPLEFNYEVVMDGQVSGNLIYLNPMLTQGEKENFFKLENRKFPVDFAAPHEETYLCVFTIPEGYKIDDQPKNMVMDLPGNGGRFAYSVSTISNNIHVMSKISIHKPVFMAEEYAYLKEFYNHIVAKHAEQIVLKKGLN